MKLMTRHTRLFLWFLPPLLAAAWLLFFYHPTYLVASAALNWLALAVCLLVVLTPWGNTRLEITHSPLIPLSNPGWVLRCLLLQMSFWLLLFGILHLLDLQNPHDAPLPLDHWRQLMRLPFSTLGLFPFAAIAILAATFGTLSYRQGRDSYLDTVCLSSFAGAPEYLQITIRTLGRSLTLSGLAIGAVMTSFAASTLLIGQTKISAMLGLTLPGFAGAFLLLVICLRRTQNLLLTAVLQQRPALGIFVNMLIWTIVICLLALLLPNQPIGGLTPPNSLVALFSEHWQQYPQVLLVMLAWMYTPIIAITLARLSYGRSLRQLILITLLPTALLAVVTHQTWLPHPGKQSALWVLLGFSGLLISILPRQALPLASQTYLAASDIKHRSELIFHARWKQVCGAVFYFFIPGGLVALSFVFSVLIVPSALILLLTMLNFIRTKCRGH